MWEHYYSVSSISEALDLLAEHGSSARIMAGGTDLILELERGQRAGVSALIDLTRVPGLDQITRHGDQIRLGPLVTHNHVVGNPLMVERALPLAQACWEVGAPQIRNRATIAGNLITASPANDTITPLMALDASVTLTSQSGERSLPLADFYSGFRQTVMRADEMMTAISFPALSSDERGIFLKLGLRRAQAIAVINVAVILRFDGDTVSEASITLGSVAPTIIHARVAEKALIGKALTPEVISEVARLVANTPEPIDDVRSTAAYRTDMLRVLSSRALRALAANEQAAHWPHDPAMLWGPSQAIVSQGLDAQTTHDGSQTIETTVNGLPMRAETGHDQTLLDFLRDTLHLPGTKEGCAEGECGACTVFLDGTAVMSCLVAAPRAHNAEIVTVEGLSQNGDLHPIQRAFVDKGAVQCGFCTPGFLMAGAKLLEEHPQPSRAQIEQSITGNLCRCTGYYKIIQAFESASQVETSEG